MLEKLAPRARLSYPLETSAKRRQRLTEQGLSGLRCPILGLGGGGTRPRNVRFSSMPYYRQVGDVPRKRHIRFERPGGGLHSEELMGVEGFSAESAMLYHLQPPTAIVKAEAVDEAPAATDVTANRPLLPSHFRTHALHAERAVLNGR